MTYASKVKSSLNSKRGPDAMNGDNLLTIFFSKNAIFLNPGALEDVLYIIYALGRIKLI